ncbi:Homogentisate 1,2-dioxygenase [Coccomyxa sp. Obi]|nr:Homogentisate 1,2-dioxygenase [Coccomyxa sp. Obi]
MQCSAGTDESKQMARRLSYLAGFGNEFQSEALPGALPVGQNNPQVCPYNLYAEQLSGTSFTMPRRQNMRSWLYRIQPSVSSSPFRPSGRIDPDRFGTQFGKDEVECNQLRWRPMPFPEQWTDFVSGLQTICGAGSPERKEGYAIHMYSANASMENTSFSSGDGDMLIVPEHGALRLTTEFGIMEVPPGEVCVVQCGIRFSVALPGGCARGYVLEVFGSHFILPDLGPVGANGLAAARDFQTPVAWYEDRQVEFVVLHKLGGHVFESVQPFSPFNVVAWHGNYAPYKYDLAKFCPVNTVSFDHADPSIFTVLTCPSPWPGGVTADFVVFPPRWTVAEHSFRPPYFHRNVMSEFMGLIRGKYEAKKDGFLPGGASLHVCMTPHGPDTDTFESGTTKDSHKPERLPADSLAFMFEVNYIPKVKKSALMSECLDKAYQECWAGLKSHFDPSDRPASNGKVSD